MIITFRIKAKKMGSLYGTCEIVEAKEDLCANDYSKRSHQARVNGSERKPPLLKQGYGKALEDDIDKLFEGINIRTSFNGSSTSEESGVGTPRKNASKKPMRMSTSSASGIGFSEPVSLKQALRGLCISQASEMAALKRLSKPPGSPALSDSGRLANMYRPGVLKASEFGSSSSATVDKEAGKVKISILPEESTSYSVGKVSHYLHESKMKSYSSSVHPSPQLNLETSKKRVGSTSKQEEIVPIAALSRGQPAMMEPAHEQKKISIPSPSCNTTDDAVKSVKNISASVKLVKKCDENVSTPSKLGKKAAPKLRRKERLHSVPSSSSVNSIKLSKSTRNSPRSVKTVKAVIRNKNLVKKKPKQVPASDPTAHSSNEVNVQFVLDTSQLICQRCQCNMKDVRKEPGKGPAVPLRTNKSAEFSFTNGNPGPIRQGSIPSSCDGSSSVVVKSNSILKSGDKGEFTQSSNSSLGEYSSSTSISEESTLSGCTVGNRPHMSKDMRWHAIHDFMKQNGFLGLRHFNLLKKLGCGDIGTVYLAELMGTNCPFAIKVMDNEFLERRKKMPRAHCEREILKILDHPFLPTLYAHFVSENLSCLVMEYCPGGDLHVLRQKQPNRYFHEQAARFYVAEVLLALEYLHMLGIVYRDLKPENILVREDGHIMLTDFDLSLRCSVNPTLLQSPSLGTLEPPRMSGPCAGSNCIDPFCIKPTCQVSCFSPKILPSAKGRKPKPDLAIQNRLLLPQLVAEPTDARSNSFVGTHEYLAPEIIKGDGHGSAVDWWTFGIFLYELLYGKTPFKGAGNDETLANVVLQSLKFPETPIVSLQARDLIRGLLVKEPEHRLGSERGAAEIKQHPFFEGLNWALIRCAIPPELPETYDIRVPKKYLDYNGSSGGHLEFELF